MLAYENFFNGHVVLISRKFLEPTADSHMFAL